jgi:hypothetical protein
MLFARYHDSCHYMIMLCGFFLLVRVLLSSVLGPDTNKTRTEWAEKLDRIRVKVRGLWVISKTTFVFVLSKAFPNMPLDGLLSTNE